MFVYVACISARFFYVMSYSWPRNRCHTIKLKLNARPAEEKHFRANHDTAELKHSSVCVFARACQYVCVICRRDSSLHMRHDTCCWKSSWEWPHLNSPQDSSLAVTPVVFKRNLPGSTAVGVIPFWLRQRGGFFFFFFFLCQASAACTPGSWYSEQNQGICIIHYSRCGTGRRHRCPGHCGRTSMSKKPKVKKNNTQPVLVFL